MNRLNRNLLATLPSEVETASFSTEAPVENIIVHLGVGAFHRAHQALYTDKVIGSHDNWRIMGASLRSPNVKEQLAPQDYLYTVVEKHNDQSHYRIVQSIQNIMVATQQSLELINAMAQTQCKIISLTITEKGYCHNPATGQLEFNHPDIVHDLKNLNHPKSAIGFIVAALQIRKDKNLTGLSILSCDNLPANGLLTRQVILSFANEVNPELESWIDVNVSFPSSMVDRIVPATQESDREDLKRELGYQDDAMVVCEPFSMWVIEDAFPLGRPKWEDAGAIFVEDVHNFETMKLRLLNGSHSAIAYLGFLAGFQHVSDVMADQNFILFIQYLMNKEIAPTIHTPASIDIDEYQKQLITRFKNTALKHATSQIAMDGSQKLPQRILQPILSSLVSNKNVDGLCLIVAAWIRYSQGLDELNNHFDISDPMAEAIKQVHVVNSDDTLRMVSEMLAIDEIFPIKISENLQITNKVSSYVSQLLEFGSKQTVKHFLNQHQ